MIINKLRCTGCMKAMHILVVGVDYKSAPIEIREKISFQPDELAEAMLRLKGEKAFLKTLSCQPATAPKYMRWSTSFIPAVII